MIQTCINFTFCYHPATIVTIINHVSLTQALKHLINVCVANKYIVYNTEFKRYMTSLYYSAYVDIVVKDSKNEPLE